MTTIIKHRRGTSTQWSASTYVLQLGELGFDTTVKKFKVGDGTSLWSALSFMHSLPSEITELAQDALGSAFDAGTHSNITVTYDDATNKISLATGPDVITQTSLSNTLTNATTGYVPISDVGNADGVASLDSNGFIPDSEIPAAIARDSELSSHTSATTNVHGILDTSALATKAYADNAASTAASALVASAHRFERVINILTSKKRPGADLKIEFLKRATQLGNYSGICLIGSKGVFLNSRGEFYPCCWTANRYDHNKSWQGKFNLHTKTFEEIVLYK
jgi:hypothetical protein